MYYIGFLEHIPGITAAIISFFVINIILVFAIIFLERKDPSATLAWIMVLFLLPIVGLILYLLFSQNIARKKIFRLTADEEWLFSNSLANQNRDISSGKFHFTNEAAETWVDLIRLNQVYGHAYYTQDNKIETIIDGEEMFNRLLEDIKNAKETINIMFFIVKNDFVGKALINALTEKAREGVTVRFLVDALGSRQIGGRMVRNFKAAGGRFALFFPPSIPIFKWLNLKFNYRNHRKLVAIDDHIGYIGGFNIAKEYLGKKKKFGYWRDTQLRICGGCAQDINARFLLDWRFAAKEKVKVSEVFFTPAICEGRSGVQIVSCGPDAVHEQVKRGFMRMISGAKKNLYIQTPYFVPDAPILESIKMAAQSGVDVKIMIPNKPDHIFVYWATYAYVGEIIRSGGRVFIYENGFLHSKTMTADGEVYTAGSTNFDRRSFRLNFESNAFVYDKEVALENERIFEADLEHCYELTQELYDQRSLWIRIKEPIARLLSDIL
jgi:cardiolipin synthase